MDEGNPTIDLTFARQQSRTRRFTLGVPRKFTISADGERVLFLRSHAGDDPVASLWSFDIAAGTERQVADARALLGGGEEDVPSEERVRRERSRELSGGIVDYACDGAGAHAAFTLGGSLWWAVLQEGGAVVRLTAPPGVVDPRPSPDGALVALLSGPSLYLVGTGPGEEAAVLAEEEGEVTWGAAEFIAAEEMRRSRGFWWSPDSTCLLAARVDSSEVVTWWTADPADPGAAPVPHRYPVAGSTDADVSLWVLEAKPGGYRRPVEWDRTRYPYLAYVAWGTAGPPLLVVEQRDHKEACVLQVDVATGATTTVLELADEAWVSWVPGTPTWSEAGALLSSGTGADAQRLKLGDDFITPAGLPVAEVLSGDGPVVFQAWPRPEVLEVWAWSAQGGLVQLSAHDGVTTAVVSGGVRVEVARSLSWHGQQVSVHVEGAPPARIADRSEVPVVDPAPVFYRVGERSLSVAVIVPGGHDGGPLPVIMAPYGGPGHQQLLAAKGIWLEAQWLADQGFAVVVVDGRGVPGRGPEWERQVYLDLAGPVLQDQVDGLVAVAAHVPELDLSRVGIRGWSFGGYLAALAVLAKPDLFRAALAGAPVTDWRYYDTYYTERFLGHPEVHPEAYERSSLLPLAPGLASPLMLVHGMSDDNVYAVHTLALSRALLLAKRRHSVLPLPGATHLLAGTDVTESFLDATVAFFRQALAAP